MALFRLTIIAAVAALAWPVNPAAANADVEFSTWQVPWEKTRPRDPYVCPVTGTIWFAGQGGHYVGHFMPEKEKFSKIDLPDGTGPHNVIVDDEGGIWIAGNLQGWIGLMNAKTETLEKFDMPDGVSDPHTLMFGSLNENGANEDGIWFTAQRSNVIAYLDTHSGDVRTWEMPRKGSRPYGIEVTEEGQPWSVLVGTNQLATIVDGELETINLPREETRPRRIALTSDGRVWYVDYAAGYLGVYDPEDESVREWRSPSEGNARPYGMAVDANDRIWYVETGPQPNRWIGFDTRAEEFISNVEIPDSGGAVRHMHFDADTNSIWFGMDTNYMARAKLPD
jgi:virginiamycin B lyase